MYMYEQDWAFNNIPSLTNLICLRRELSKLFINLRLLLSARMYLKWLCFYIIAEWFFLYYHLSLVSFGLVRLRTIQLSAHVGAHIECRCSRSRGEDVTITDVIIKTPDRIRTGDVKDVMPGSDGLRILGDFWKKAVSWDKRLDEASWFLDRGEASPVMDYGMTARCWVGWNSQHSRNCVSLSPRVEKT